MAFLADDYLARFRSRKAEEAAAKPMPSRSCVMIPAADPDDVMREQLDIVLEVGPSEPRYLALRAILLAPFAVGASRAIGVGA